MQLITKLASFLILIILSLFYSNTSLYAQENEVPLVTYFNENFSNTNLLEDLDFIVGKIEDKAFNRNPFNFVEKDDFYKQFEIVKSYITSKENLTRKEFYNMVGPLLSMVKDDHASIRISGNWKKNVLKRNFSKENIVLPLSILISDNNCYVVASDTLPIKSKVISINDIPMNEVILTCNQYVNTNEYCAVKKNMMTMFNFPKNAAELWSVYGFEDNVTIKYIPFGDTKEENLTVKLHKMNDKSFIQNYKIVPIKMTKQPKLEFREETAILTLPSFRMGRKMDESIKNSVTFFNKSFEEINKTKPKNLIIDISNNLGGSEIVGLTLLNYIYKNKYKGTLYQDAKTPSAIIDSFIVPILGEGIKDEINANFYNGNVYLLISGMTFSAAARFADIFKTYSIGEIIGRETKAFRTHYGEVKWHTLPNTELSLRISSKFFVSASGDKKPHGIIPDHKINYNNVNDLFDRFGANFLLEKALEYVDSK